MEANNVIVYQPDKQLHMGFGAVWKEMLTEIISSRELIWRLFLRNFQAKYKQSLFGIAWVLINPLVTVSVFIFLNRSGVMNIKTPDVPYPVYALLGLTLWVIFSKGLTACTDSIVSAGAMVVKVNFPKISLVIAAMGQAVVELWIRAILTGIIFIMFRIVPSKMAFLFPILILPVFFLTCGLGFFLALLAGLFRDTVNIVTLLSTYFLFIMPVVYPLPESGILNTINRWNPLSHIIIACREAVLYGSIPNVVEYICSSLFCLALFLASWRLFHLVETKIPERI